MGMRSMTILVVALWGASQAAARSIRPDDFVDPVVLTFGDYSGFVGGPTYPDPWLSEGVRIRGFASSGYVFVYPYSNNAVEIEFLNPVQRVGADVLYSISTTTRLEVYDAQGSALESVDGIGPRFLGIDAGAPAIHSARFIDFPDAWSTFPNIDNLRFESVSVSEPSSLVLLGAGVSVVLTLRYASRGSRRRGPV